MRPRSPIRGAAPVLAILAALLPMAKTLRSQPQYAARQAHTCQSCHVSPTGGFGRWSRKESLSFADGRVFLSGDVRFLAVYDGRSGNDRAALFPMEGAIHLGIEPVKSVTVAASNDLGQTREFYALYQPRQSFYARAGWFTLPYGLLVADHTAFIKEGRVEVPGGTTVEKGIGAGLFGTRYKDGGVEAGFVGPPAFLNVAVTDGNVGQAPPGTALETDTKKAFTGRAGWMTKHAMIGGAYFRNPTLALRETRYGAFGWLAWDPLVLLAEFDRGEDKSLIPGNRSMSALYAELLWKSPRERFAGAAKLRYERLDPDLNLADDVLERLQGGYEWFPWRAGSLEFLYRHNRETPETGNDDLLLMNHLYF